MTTSTAPSVPTDHGLAEPVAPSRSRQCGRCRAWFADPDPSSPAGKAAWWLCAPCHQVLMPRPTRAQP